MNAYQNIKVERHDRVARLTLNRPDKLNAFNASLMDELIDFLNKMRRDKGIHIIVFKGEGRAFSAGVDLKETAPGNFGKDTGIIKKGLALAQIVTTMPQVTIGQIHGYCFTGALELALMFDLLYCDHVTQFGDTHVQWAIMPRWGMTQRLARRVGLHKAKELTFRALRFDGKKAEQIGLVNESFNPDELESQVEKVVQDILRNSQEAIKRIKTLYDDGYSGTLSEGLRRELEADPRLSETAQWIKDFDKRKQ